MPSSSPPKIHRSQAIFCLFCVIIFWSIGPIFVKSFTWHYDVWTQNAFRYLSATILLFAFFVLRRQPIFIIPREHWANLGLVALANVLMQTAYGMIYYFLFPSVAIFVGQISVVMIVVMSFILFHDERQVIRSQRFLIGTSLALAGVVIVILKQDPETLAHLKIGQRDFWIGIGLTMLWAFFSALYVVTIKRLVRHVGPLVAFTNVSWITSLGLLVLMFALGKPASLWHQPAGALFGLIWTGFVCIALAHTMYYVVIRSIKVVVVSTVMELAPILTCALSALQYGDKLSPLQMVGAAATLGGAWLASAAQAQAAGAEPSSATMASGEAMSQEII